MGAVRGKIIEVCKVGDSDHFLKGVDYFIRAFKVAVFLQIRVHYKVGQQLLCGLLLGDARYIGVSEAVVCKGGDMYFRFAAFEGIDCLL